MQSKLITKKELLSLTIILIVLAVTIISYSSLPVRIPSNWNYKVEIDGYISKKVAVVLFPSIILAIYLLMTFLPLIDPLRKNIEKSASAYFGLKLILISYFSLMHIFTLVAGIVGFELFPANLFFLPLFGLMIIGLGFLLPKFKKNYFVGIRTPWTLHSEEIWNAIHQRAKKWFIGAGLLLILGSPFRRIGAWLLVIMILMLLWPVVDSYLLYKKQDR